MVDTQVEVYRPCLTVGAGLVFKPSGAVDLFFTHQGREVASVLLPETMEAQHLYSSLMLGCKEDEFALQFSGSFLFDLAEKTTAYYREVYAAIQAGQIDTSFQRVVRDYLHHEGYSETLHALEPERRRDPDVEVRRCKLSIGISYRAEAADRGR